MDRKLEQIYNLVEKSFDEEDYKYHTLLVVKYAKKLAEIYNADLELVEIAALLHDIGRADIEKDPIHHIVGAQETEKIMKDLEYPDDTIKEVVHAVYTHRAKEEKPETLVAKIVANADAMSHFEVIPMFYFWRGKRNIPFDEITKWVEEKLKRNWEEKLTFPEAKEMVKEKYEIAKIMLAYLKK